MGAQFASAHSALNMKLLVVLALAAIEPEAEAKADPYLLYGGYGLGHLGYGHLGYGLGYGSYYYGKREAEPKAEAEPYYYGAYGLGYHGLGYHGLGYRGYYYGKREAEAEPKADPYLLYGGYYGHGLGY